MTLLRFLLSFTLNMHGSVESRSALFCTSALRPTNGRTAGDMLRLTMHVVGWMQQWAPRRSAVCSVQVGVLLASLLLVRDIERSHEQTVSANLPVTTATNTMAPTTDATGNTRSETDIPNLRRIKTPYSLPGQNITGRRVFAMFAARMWHHVESWFTT